MIVMMDNLKVINASQTFNLMRNFFFFISFEALAHLWPLAFCEVIGKTLDRSTH